MECIRSFTPYFLQRYLSTAESDQMPPFHATLHSQSATPLLKEWGKLILRKVPWQDAMGIAVHVSMLLLWYLPLVGLTLRWYGVYATKIHDLSNYL